MPGDKLKLKNQKVEASSPFSITLANKGETSYITPISRARLRGRGCQTHDPKSPMIMKILLIMLRVVLQ